MNFEAYDCCDQKILNIISRFQKLYYFISILAGAAQYDEFFMGLKTLEVAFQVSVKDLRSQVVREACITIAYMSQLLRLKVDRFLEALMQNLINLIPNSAKVRNFKFSFPYPLQLGNLWMLFQLFYDI